MNLRRAMLLGERIIRYLQKKKEKDNCDRNSNSIPISREDIERV